jgi:hypothetical protein
MTKPRPYRARTSVLPILYRRWLLSGRPGYLPFLEGERVKQLWHDFGDVVTERHVRRRPFTRPANWWRYSSPEWRDPSRETQREFLLRHPGLLTEAERRRARPRVGAD